MSTAQIRRRRTRSLRSRDGLIRFAHDITSQGGEDGILSKIFELIPPSRQMLRCQACGFYKESATTEQNQQNTLSCQSSIKQRQNRRYCVDIGAWDGKKWSNTYPLLVPQNGQEGESPGSQTKTGGENDVWHGILVEAHPQRFEELKRLHQPLGNIPVLCNVSCVEKPINSDKALIFKNETASASQSMSLRQLLKIFAPHLPRDFDLLCIDVDGTDYWLLRDILTSNMSNDDNGVTDAEREVKCSCKYQPLVLCVEFNPTIPHDTIYIQPQNDNIRHGSSLAALVELVCLYWFMRSHICVCMYKHFFMSTQLSFIMLSYHILG